MSGFTTPPGDVGAIRGAAAALSAAASDLHGRSTAVEKAAATAIGDWRGPRSMDFRRVGLTLVDELQMAESIMSQAAGLLSTYATALQNLQSEVVGYSNKLSQAQATAEQQSKKDPDNALDYHRGAAARAQSLSAQAATAQSEATNLAKRLASDLHSLIAVAVPNSDGLSPADLQRRVDDATGVTGFPAVGPVTTDELWRIFAGIDNPVFTDAPKPGDPAFQTWYAALTPLQQEMAQQQMWASFSTQDFNPYSTIKGGSLPAWAQAFNKSQELGYCTVDNPSGQGPYGYFGGGTVAGPGGVQWPIVMPFYRDKDGHIFMADDGAGRTDGGIDQLDGKDAGWTTVGTYSGVNQYGSISTGLKVAVAFLGVTGNGLETTQTDAGAVEVGPDGLAYAGHDVANVPESPAEKETWDVTSDEVFPKGSDDYVGPVALLDQAAQAAQAVHNMDSHTSRQWYIAYQVNADGRTRAVVRTYTAGPTEDGGTYVGSFANSFPDGNGTTQEIPYDTRYNAYTQPTLTAGPDQNVEYSDRGGQDGPTPIISEKVKK